MPVLKPLLSWHFQAVITWWLLSPVPTGKFLLAEALLRQQASPSSIFAHFERSPSSQEYNIIWLIQSEWWNRIVSERNTRLISSVSLMILSKGSFRNLSCNFQSQTPMIDKDPNREQADLVDVRGNALFQVGKANTAQFLLLFFAIMSLTKSIRRIWRFFLIDCLPLLRETNRYLYPYFLCLFDGRLYFNGALYRIKSCLFQYNEE